MLILVFAEAHWSLLHVQIHEKNFRFYNSLIWRRWSSWCKLIFLFFIITCHTIFINYCSFNLSADFYVLQYSIELVVWNRIKTFSNIKVYDVTWSVTSVMSCKLIEKSQMLSQRRSLLDKAMLDIRY